MSIQVFIKCLGAEGYQLSSYLSFHILFSWDYEEPGSGYKSKKSMKASTLR